VSFAAVRKWLQPGACVPVDIETVKTLLLAVRELSKGGNMSNGDAFGSYAYRTQNEMAAFAPSAETRRHQRRLLVEKLARELFAARERLRGLESSNAYGLEREKAEALAVEHALARADVASLERTLEEAINA